MVVELSEARVDGLFYTRADWVQCQCCPPPLPSARRRPIEIFSVFCRFLEHYREKVMFQQLDDHLLDDIGVDVQSVQRIRLRERAVRQLSLTACGGHI